MRYVGVTIDISRLTIEKKEILTALLDSLNFEGITEQENNVIAYIPFDDYKRTELENVLKDAEILPNITIDSEEKIEEKNWNEEWEKNFEPVIVDEICAIRAPFHPEYKEFKFVITIEPKMSFGTGHHATTSLMVSAMLQMSLSNKVVLDMGCGTGLLGILASKMGANEIVAIDIDKWAFENSVENTERNNVQMTVIQGGEESIPATNFDILLANINRNILLDQKQSYFNHLKKDGILLISGILAEDVTIILEAFKSVGFKYKQVQSKGNWQLMEFTK